MKVSIDKRHFNMDCTRAVYARRNEMRQALTTEEIHRAAAFYTEDEAIWGVYDVQATICKHIGGLYTCESDNPIVDCFIEMLVETIHACYRVSFYVLVFWQVAHGFKCDNRDEVRRRAFIRKYVEAK